MLLADCLPSTHSSRLLIFFQAFIFPSRSPCDSRYTEPILSCKASLLGLTQWFSLSVVLRLTTSALFGILLEMYNQKSKFSAPNPSRLLNQKLWGWGLAICILLSPPADSDAGLYLRTTCPHQSC